MLTMAATTDDPLLWLAGIGCLGIGLGIGLVIGAFVARMVRRYARGDDDS
jgi:hypothetical protein